MSIFEDVDLGEWKGARYRIPADDVLRCIAKVEDVVSLGELGQMRVTGNLKIAKLCKGLGAAMRHAGAEVSDDELYDTIFTAQGKELSRRAWATLYALECLMIPPEHLRAAEGASGKAVRGKRAASSKKRTRSS